MANRIGEILMRLGYVKDEDIQRALAIQLAEGKRRRLGEILTEMFLDKKALVHALSMQETGYVFDTGLDIVSHITRHRLRQADIRSMLCSLSARGNETFLDKVSDILEKIASFLNISSCLSESLSLDDLLGAMIAMVNETLGAERSTLFLYDKETGELFSRVAQGGQVEEIRFPGDLGIAGSVFHTGTAVIIDDAYADPRFNQEVDRQTGFVTRNILCAPLRTKTGQVVGVIQVLNKVHGPFTSDDLTLLEALSAQAGSALHNAQLFQEIQRAKEEESRLLEVTTAISTELKLQPLLLKIMQTATDILQAERSTLFMYDERRHQLWSLVAQLSETREIRIPADRGIAGEVFTTGVSVNIADAYSDQRFNPEVDRKTGYRTRNILCVPVATKEGKPVGVIQSLNKKGGPFTGVDERRLRAFAAQASIAIENAKLFDDVLAMKNYNEGILESMSNGVITLDAGGQIVKANSAAARILRTTPAQLTGQPAAAWFAGRNSWVLERVAKVLAQGESDMSFDTELDLADGKPISANLTVVPLRGTGQEGSGSVLLLLEDITTEKRLKSTMARYMTKEVADKLMEGGEAILGGQLSEATILFSDIRGFTTLAEGLGPAETVSMLNEYFTLMVDIVFSHHGILDKYIGDAMLAVFGAPFATGQDPDNAVQAAIEQLRALRELNRRRAASRQPPIRIGVGINTGEVLSGNIGSLKRMDYTVVGDGVNLASRLEGANKYYGTSILISAFTHGQLVRPYRSREVDLMRVKGKTRPVAVYEILDHHDQESFPCLDQVLEIYHQGLAHYRSREWPTGLKLFEDALSRCPQDGLSRMYADRCRLFLAQPPPADWDGVWDMKSK
ncbi:MAG: GAF domain-containing protein [Thermodesulfobacteriota bacterium]